MAKFFGWTLEYVRSLSFRDYKECCNMIKSHEREAKENRIKQKLSNKRKW
jgi:hypothetical protein